jgi:hypothetical protein
MIAWFTTASLFLLAQDAPTAAWRSDVDAVRKEARRDGKPCVLLLRSDATAH